ncbi:MAG: hypothetical protein ABIK98_11010 [Pseudomonadota bacterium]|uniref:Tetratricopeptide repeat protein n=1 Tax=Candidatus Desulfatibia profunda TaxID=2841695 RepID=A0A8J6NWC3_9BACT|nr:hypothetical protein [Candidatus Desulfatibia profunda]MBL7179343.1 hypothetical protein [Desulfobacterales bacterium]
MIKDDIFYTKTMAKVYADQGKLSKAAEIYNYLLKKEPACQDLIDALSELDKKRFEKGCQGLDDLFGTWLDLLLVHRRLQTLRKLQRQLK